MTTSDDSRGLAHETQGTWRRFLELYEPLRPALFKYARHLTSSVWDAEDLTQDTLARAFVTLAQLGAEPPAPRAWLFRVASNLWIDRKRRERAAPLSVAEVPARAEAPSRAAREAGGTLLAALSPQERAAVVLKDAFDLSLEETAAVLGSTVGGIKAALHRGRGKLVDEPIASAEAAPHPRVLDAFCEAFNRGDLEALAALLLDTSVVHVVGATTQYGREAARRTVLTGALFGARFMASGESPLDPALVAGLLPTPPRVTASLHRGRWTLAHWYEHEDGEAVRAFSTLELDDEGEGVASLTNYFYNPELIEELGAELGYRVRTNGHLWWRGDRACGLKA